MKDPSNKVSLLIILIFVGGIVLSTIFDAFWIMIIAVVLGCIVVIKKGPSVKKFIEKQNGIGEDQMSWEDMRRYYKYPSERDAIIAKYAGEQGYTPEQIQAFKESQATYQPPMYERTGRQSEYDSKSFEAAPASSSSRRSDNGTVEVTVQTTEPMASFIFNIDDRVFGYIGPQRSTLSVPVGMHKVSIVTSDMNRKEIYSENILFNTEKSFTVKKKLGGFSVIKN